MQKQSEISSQVNGESDAVNGDKDTDPFAGNDGERLDRYVSVELGVSRAQVQNWLNVD